MEISSTDHPPALEMQTSCPYLGPALRCLHRNCRFLSFLSKPASSPVLLTYIKDNFRLSDDWAQSKNLLFF